MEDTGWIDEVHEGERPCPVCGKRMYVEKKSNVSIDVCADHGIWLDRGELDAIVMAARKRGRRRQRSAVKEARRKG
jgi:Zn-finger nucleic acid-binding protein